MTQNAKCWNCRYCDKESVLINGKWYPTKSGYCLAEHSAANGPDLWNQKVYSDTIQPQCAQFQERDEFL